MVPGPPPANRSEARRPNWPRDELVRAARPGVISHSVPSTTGASSSGRSSTSRNSSFCWSSRAMSLIGWKSRSRPEGALSETVCRFVRSRPPHSLRRDAGDLHEGARVLDYHVGPQVRNEGILQGGRTAHEAPRSESASARRSAGAGLRCLQKASYMPFKGASSTQFSVCP